MVFLLTNMLNILSCNGKLNNRWWWLLLLHINMYKWQFFSKSFAMFLGNFRCEKGPIWFQNRSIWFQNRPIWFQKGPIWFQKGPICFTGVPFHKCPIYFTDVPFISKQQVSQNYHCVLHLTAEVNKHTSRKCQQSNTIYSHLFQGPSHLFQSNSPSTIITSCIWLLKWTSIIPAGNVNSPTRYSVSLWWCMHPTKRGNYSLNRITCRVWRCWCVVIYH